MKKNKNLILSLLAVLTVIIITGGVTYAFFSYAKTGTTDNVLTTDTIAFLYTEVDGVGNGIKIENAFPMSDEKGKVLTKTNEYFDFKVTSKTASTIAIPYEVTAKKSKDSDNIDEYIRVYLTKGETNEEVLLENYDKLDQTDKVDVSKWTEKTIYTGKVPSNTPDYEESFRLRMWLDEKTRFDTTDMNDKTFTLTVNVYANAKVVTEEEILSENQAEIKTLTIEGTELTKVEDKDYDYETILPEDRTSTTINIETESPNATVKVEKIDSLAKTNNVKKLAVTKTLELTNGENLFKVTVISENKKVENEYKIKITVGKLTLSQAILNKYSVIEDEPTLDKTSSETGENGLYKWTNPDNASEVSYYFRGNVDNTVEFAEQTWKVIRINEDGTIRLIMENGINDNNTYVFNSDYDNYKYMYYSNSTAKIELETWYQTSILDAGYSANVVTGNYFCEAAKAKAVADYTSGSATMQLYNDYDPTFKCEPDGNGYGTVEGSIGLITYDEVVYAGGHYPNTNNKYYLYDGLTRHCTMSPSGVHTANYAHVWNLKDSSEFSSNSVAGVFRLRPVINLKADTPVVEGTDTVWKVVE